MKLNLRFNNICNQAKLDRDSLIGLWVVTGNLRKFVIEAVTYSYLLARKSGENHHCTLDYTEAAFFCRKNDVTSIVSE